MDTSLYFVRDQRPEIDIYCSAEEWHFAEQFVDAIYSYTKTKLMLITLSFKPETRNLYSRLLIGSSKNKEIARYIDIGIKPEGFAIKSVDNTIIVAGSDSSGVRNGLWELFHYRLVFTNSSVYCPDINILKEPDLQYRWLWIITDYMHWDERHGSPHIADVPPYIGSPIGYDAMFPGKNYSMSQEKSDILVPKRFNPAFMGSENFFNTSKAMIDWASQHKINGAIIWGLLDKSGLGTTRLIVEYGRQQGIEIIAGIGTTAFGGTYYGGANSLNLAHLYTLRPSLFVPGPENEPVPCPSIAEMQQYWEETGEWIANAMPELGGLYLENGDLRFCVCETCTKEREKIHNDSGCYWDMMRSEIPIIRGAKRIRPNWKYVYATYTSPTQLDRGTKRTPPKFTEYYPKETICQWSVTAMTGEEWDKVTLLSEHNIGLFHNPSRWGFQCEPERWWSGPGTTHDDSSATVQLYCKKMAGVGFEGLVLKGATSFHSPGPFLSYLALGDFSFNSNMTIEQWETERLSKLFGGEEFSREFLRMARDNSTTSDERNSLVKECKTMLLQVPDHTKHYWVDLLKELQYRETLLSCLHEKSFKIIDSVILKKHIIRLCQLLDSQNITYWIDSDLFLTCVKLNGQFHPAHLELIISVSKGHADDLINKLRRYAFNVSDKSGYIEIDTGSQVPIFIYISTDCLSLKAIDIWGSRLWCPKDTMEFLKLRYGSGFRVGYKATWIDENTNLEDKLGNIWKTIYGSSANREFKYLCPNPYKTSVAKFIYIPSESSVYLLTQKYTPPKE